MRAQMKPHLYSDWPRCLSLDQLEPRCKLICALIGQASRTFYSLSNFLGKKILFLQSTSSGATARRSILSRCQTLDQLEPRCKLICALIVRFLFFKQLPLKVNSISSVDIIRRDSPQIHLVLRQFCKFIFHSQTYFAHI